MYFMYLVYSIRNEFKGISYFEEIAIEKFKLNTSKKNPQISCPQLGFTQGGHMDKFFHDYA